MIKKYIINIRQNVKYNKTERHLWNDITQYMVQEIYILYLKKFITKKIINLKSQQIIWSTTLYCRKELEIMKYRPINFVVNRSESSLT